MNYETILTETSDDIFIITINRVQQKNSLNEQLIIDIAAALDEAQKLENCHAVVLQGKEGLFCTGMDFEQVTKEITAGSAVSFTGDCYMKLLKQINTISKIVIAKVDGKVLAGGMGIVAACDVVIATPKSQFGLSEAMWGLLPANVMPFLIRRVGYQSAYLLTLTMQNIAAQKAYEMKLVDEVSENLDDVLRRLLINFRRLSDDTISEAKQFFRKMWIIDDEMEQVAIHELEKLVNKKEVMENIKNFVLYKKFPWDKE